MQYTNCIHHSSSAILYNAVACFICKRKKKIGKCKEIIHFSNRFSASNRHPLSLPAHIIILTKPETLGDHKAPSQQTIPPFYNSVKLVQLPYHATEKISFQNSDTDIMICMNHPNLISCCLSHISPLKKFH